MNIKTNTYTFEFVYYSFTWYNFETVDLCIYKNMKLFWKYFGSIFNIAPYMYCLKQMVQIYEHYNLTDSHLCLAYDIVNALVEHNRNIIPPFLIFHHINTNFKTSFQTYISPTNVIHI